ncbi:adenosine deaminase [bacterium]|nr:adenosine deaminase [bacterium]
MIHKDLPLMDLHRHLDGSIRLETIIDLGKKYELPLPSFDKETLRPYVQVVLPQPGVMAFIAKFKWMVGVLADYDACRRVAFENVVDAENEGLDYVELRFSPWFMAEPHQLDPASVVAAIVEGVAEAERSYRVKVNLIGIISRTYGPEVGMQELKALLTQKEHLVALDLAGDEKNFPAALFEEHFRIGREAGWDITVHAGEAVGPESVWQAINLLGAKRIGHAARIGEDLELVEYMRDNSIGIEANLTSNYQTSTVASLADHPLKSWLDQGLKACINTDDPGISNIDLPYEFEVAAPAAGLSENHTRLAQQYALEMAFLSPEEKASLTFAY